MNNTQNLTLKNVGQLRMPERSRNVREILSLQKGKLCISVRFKNKITNHDNNRGTCQF